MTKYRHKITKEIIEAHRIKRNDRGGVYKIIDKENLGFIYPQTGDFVIINKENKKLISSSRRG